MCNRYLTDLLKAFSAATWSQHKEPNDDHISDITKAQNNASASLTSIRAKSDDNSASAAKAGNLVTRTQALLLLGSSQEARRLIHIGGGDASVFDQILRLAVEYVGDGECLRGELFAAVRGARMTLTAVELMRVYALDKRGNAQNDRDQDDSWRVNESRMGDEGSRHDGLALGYSL